MKNYKLNDMIGFKFEKLIIWQISEINVIAMTRNEEEAISIIIPDNSDSI